jgi:hypothetical protein
VVVFCGSISFITSGNSDFGLVLLYWSGLGAIVLRCSERSLGSSFYCCSLISEDEVEFVWIAGTLAARLPTLCTTWTDFVTLVRVSG